MQRDWRGFTTVQNSPRRLTADEEAALAAVIIAGPEPERDGVCAWTRADLCRWLEERFAKTYHPSSMTRVLPDGIFPPEGAPEPPAKGRPDKFIETSPFG